MSSWRRATAGFTGPVGTAVVEFYTPGDSWLHRADPRVKLLFTAVSVVSLLLVRQLLLTAALGALMLLLYGTSRLPANRSLQVLKAMAPISLLMAGLRTLFYPGGAELLVWGPLRVTSIGLADGAALGLRLVVMALAVFLWLYTTHSRAIVQSLVRLGLPYPWGLALSMALRYIPTLGYDYQIITQSQQARGLDLRAKRGLNRVRAMLPGLLALIVGSFRTSEHMARALEARAYGAPGVRRTYLHELSFRPVDWLYLAICLLAFIGLLYLRIRYGFGAAPLAWAS